MDRIAELLTIVENPYFYLQQLKDKTGKKIVGTVCSYAPEELIFAAGALPVRLFGSDSGIHRADLHLQSYCCSLVRGILEEALSGRLDLLDGMVFPHTCDSIQRLSDVWRLNLVKPFHADVVLPVKLTTPSARQYLIDVLAKFKTDLERGLSREITEAGLIHAVKIYNAIRAQMTRLYQLRCENPQIIKGQDFHTIVRAAMIMEREAFLETLSAIVAELTKTAPGKKASGARRLVLSGGICNHPDIYDAIESAGGVVAGDDLCTGSRYFEGVINENLPPLTAIAHRYAERGSCPAKHAGLTRRGESLVRMAKDCKADGVVFMLLKFCDPHAFDYPYLKEMLDREKIPSLLLEVEEQTGAGGQLQTRLETFIQIL
ncbi:MAG: 2-hydroxyacyl-CoA dehydratase [Deltaproteobacteria bacterium HGW-Deltaproteobacteria-6]|jgi:bzd-type benzoyl-CoA reductase N subunit|nr:MAG: 2-hydroxyacyl-CoA dehydratase [Deltaproteobacteria bacterium HGW-Deltaproteobacteria-6]